VVSPAQPPLLVREKGRSGPSPGNVQAPGRQH